MGTLDLQFGKDTGTRLVGVVMASAVLSCQTNAIGDRALLYGEADSEIPTAIFQTVDRPFDDFLHIVSPSWESDWEEHAANVLNDFAQSFLSKMHEPEPEINSLIEEHLWDLV